MKRRKSLGLAVLGLGLWIGLTTSVYAAGAEDERFRQVVTYHLGRYSAMEMQDLYKLVFQAAMGSEHAVPNRQAAQQWLERELATLVAGSEQPLSEPLSPDGELVRVNLRAFVEQGGDPKKLVDAFVTTANRFEASEKRLARYWGYLEAMAETGEIAYDRRQLEEWLTEMRTQGFPTVHHSNTYRKLYQPAYRVVYRELLSSESPLITGQ